MFNTYDNCHDIKVEMSDYIEILNKNNTFNNVNILRGTVKYILFFKQVKIFREEKHFAKCMMYDLLITMHSITLSSLKTFYCMYRSFIENSIRFILDKEDLDDTGVRNLFNELSALCTTQETIKIKNFIEGEYGKCCSFVHSNINSGLGIYEYYEEILLKDVLTTEMRDSLLKSIFTYLKMYCELLIRLRPDWIDIAFYRKRQKLKFLISEKIYTLLL